MENIVEEIKKSLEFYKKNDKVFSKIDIIETDVKLNTYKKWAHSFWDTKKVSVIKIIEEPNLGKIANVLPKAYLSNFIIDNIKGDIIFIKILQNKDILNKLNKNDICKLLELVFRLKSKISKDQRYFIPFDLLYYKLK